MVSREVADRSIEAVFKRLSFVRQRRIGAKRVCDPPLYGEAGWRVTPIDVLVN